MINNGRGRRPAYLPLLGFVLAAVIGAAAWFAAPAVVAGLADALPFFRGTELPLTTSRPIFTAIIVGLALLVFGIVAALTAPKDPQRVREAAVERDRAALRRQQRAERAEARKSKGRR